jgi:hypothetical protein
MAVDESTRLLDVHQAATRRLWVSDATIRRRVRTGDLLAFRVAPNGPLRIPAGNVDALLRPVRREDGAA